MNELNILNKEVKTMTSREICEVTGKRHDNTIRLIKSLIDKGLIRSPQFEGIFLEDSYGRKQPAFALDKTASILVVAQQSPEFTAKIIERWQELESKVTLLPDFNDPVASARAWADQVEIVQERDLQLAEATPKVAVYESLAERERDVKTTVLAKQLGTNATALNKFLKNKGIKFKYDDLPIASYDSWFNVIAGITSSGREYSQCLVSPLGMIEITKLWNKNVIKTGEEK